MDAISTVGRRREVYRISQGPRYGDGGLGGAGRRGRAERRRIGRSRRRPGLGRALRPTDAPNPEIPVRRGKAPYPSGCESRPATVAPAGSSRSARRRQRHRVEHFDDKGRRGRFSEHAGRNVSERRAGLETGNAEADPSGFRGRLPPAGKRATRAPAGSAGVVAVARMQDGYGGNTGSPDGVKARDNRSPARGGPGRSGVAERPVLPLKRGNAGGGKGPWFESGVERREGRGDWREPISSSTGSETPAGATCESEGSSGHPFLLAVRQGVARGRSRVRLAGGSP